MYICEYRIVQIILGKSVQRSVHVDSKCQELEELSSDVNFIPFFRFVCRRFSLMQSESDPPSSLLFRLSF